MVSGRAGTNATSDHVAAHEDRGGPDPEPVDPLPQVGDVVEPDQVDQPVRPRHRHQCDRDQA
ncbi:MAG TPA: hypothetical protein VNU02_15840, partial [Candidatus Dormibacteraeota bacterium]|nr:hypothetical protein [Candidatus Dormibacteraeota bacterium]